MPGQYQVWSIVLSSLTGHLGRVGRFVASAAVLSLVVGGTVAYASASKSVTLVVDGKSSHVSALAGTVGDLLGERGVHVSARDLVAPATSSPVKDGERIVVRFARPFTLVVDGRPQEFWTTAATVDDALAALGIRTDGDRLTVSRSQPLGRSGLTVGVSTPKKVTVVADGRTTATVTTAPTVADLLAEQGLTIRAFDRLSALATARVVQDMKVVLTRIDHRRVTATETLAYGTSRRTTSSLYTGQSKVLAGGRTGSRVAVYDVVIVNGKVAARALVSATVTSTPVPRVLAVGTKSKPVATVTRSVGGSVGSLNWTALAKCESGGNPRAVNPSGYYGLYQFSLSTWHAVGGVGNPINASPSEQLYRAEILYQRAGAGQWTCGHWLFT